jgi:hypothetical protein
LNDSGSELNIVKETRLDAQNGPSSEADSEIVDTAKTTDILDKGMQHCMVF